MRSYVTAVPRLLGAVGSLAVLFAQPASAAIATSTFNVNITIQAQCVVQTAASIGDLAFGNAGVLNANVDSSTTFTVQCTDTTPYEIGLDNGNNFLAGTRRMKNGTAYVNYDLYQDAARGTPWGDYAPGAAIGANAETSTGDGTPQTFTVYGRVPPQTTPAPATYSDVVTITVEY